MGASGIGGMMDALCPMCRGPMRVGPTLLTQDGTRISRPHQCETVIHDFMSPQIGDASASRFGASSGSRLGLGAPPRASPLGRFLP